MKVFFTAMLFSCFATKITFAQATQHAKQAGEVNTESSEAKFAQRLDRIEGLLSAVKGFKDAEYIEKVEKQYEAYYEKVFRAQEISTWVVGVMIPVLLLAVGAFSVNNFQKQVDVAIKDATDKLNLEFSERLKKEVAELRDLNEKQTNVMAANIREETNQLAKNLKQHAVFHQQFLAALTFAQAKRWDDALKHYEFAVQEYLENKEALISKKVCATVVANIFKAINSKDSANFARDAKEELKKLNYKKLTDVLAAAAVIYPTLAPVLSEVAKEKT